MVNFPSTEYAGVHGKWIGTTYLVTPTVKYAVNQGQLINGKKVLDVGCGTGLFSNLMVELGAHHVHGIDISEEMIRKCKQTYNQESKLSFECENILDLSSEGYDIALSWFVLQFLDTKEKLKEAMKKIYNSLSDGGIFVALVPNGVENYNPKAEEGMKLGAAAVVDPSTELSDELPLRIVFYDTGKEIGNGTIYFYWRKTYTKLLEECGFKKVEWLDPVISEEGLRVYGTDFFHSYLSPPKDAVFRAYK